MLFCWLCHEAAHLIMFWQCWILAGAWRNQETAQRRLRWYQPEHPPSLIILRKCTGWSESSLGTHVILLVLSCSSSKFCSEQLLWTWHQSFIRGFWIKINLISACHNVIVLFLFFFFQSLFVSTIDLSEICFVVYAVQYDMWVCYKLRTCKTESIALKPETDIELKKL